MTAPINISAARAKQCGDCRLWTPLDALRDTIERIESGKLNPDMLYIAMREVAGSMASWPSTSAGVTSIEAAGLLSAHLHEQLSDRR